MILGPGIVQVSLKLVLQRTTTKIVDLTDGSLVTILISNYHSANINLTWIPVLTNHISFYLEEYANKPTVREYERNEGQTIAADLIKMYSLGRDIKVTN